MPPNTESIANTGRLDDVYDTPYRLFYDSLGLAAQAALERATAQRVPCAVIKAVFYNREVYMVTPNIKLVSEQHILYRAEPEPLDTVDS